MNKEKNFEQAVRSSIIQPNKRIPLLSKIKNNDYVIFSTKKKSIEYVYKGFRGYFDMEQLKTLMPSEYELARTLSLKRFLHVTDKKQAFINSIQDKNCINDF